MAEDKKKTQEASITGFQITGSLGVSMSTKKDNWLKPTWELAVQFDGLPTEQQFQENCNLLWAKLEDAMSDHLDVLLSE